MSVAHHVVDGERDDPDPDEGLCVEEHDDAGDAEVFRCVLIGQQLAEGVQASTSIWPQEARVVFRSPSQSRKAVAFRCTRITDITAAQAATALFPPAPRPAKLPPRSVAAKL